MSHFCLLGPPPSRRSHGELRRPKPRASGARCWGYPLLGHPQSLHQSSAPLDVGENLGLHLHKPHRLETEPKEWGEDFTHNSPTPIRLSHLIADVGPALGFERARAHRTDRCARHPRHAPTRSRITQWNPQASKASTRHRSTHVATSSRRSGPSQTSVAQTSSRSSPPTRRKICSQSSGVGRSAWKRVVSKLKVFSNGTRPLGCVTRRRVGAVP